MRYPRNLALVADSINCETSIPPRSHEHDSLLWRGGEKGGEFRVRFPRLKSSGTTYRASNRAVELIVIRNEEYCPTLPLISMIWSFFWDGSI